jgi:O-methyltransferase
MLGLLTLKAAAKYALTPLLYRSPPSGLQPERLYLFLHHLIQCRGVEGHVVEVGCNLAGTAVLGSKMLERLGIDKRYICYDTFDGFTDEQFTRDRMSGTPRRDRHAFSANSKRLVERILRQHSASRVELVQGDIAQLPDEMLPDKVAMCLLDVDLSEPTYIALKRLHPRLSEGGVILVDDCPSASSWKARRGYERFMSEVGAPERYEYGMAILRKGS